MRQVEHRVVGAVPRPRRGRREMAAAAVALTAALGLAAVPVRAAAAAPSFRSPAAELPAAAAPYGGAVAISGDSAAVSGVAGGQASVFVFVRSTAGWSEEAQIVAPGDAAADLFGSALALSGDTLAVGAGAPGVAASSVYVYVRSGGDWSLQAHLQPPRIAHLGFGASLALAGDLLAVGVPGTEDGTAIGAAYLYERSGSTWARQAVLGGAQPEPGDRYGQAVAVAHQAVVVGGQGVADVYERQGAAWARTASFQGSGAGFGGALSASNETMAVGDPLGQVVSLFIHTPQGWFHQQDVAAPAGAAEFGSALALSLDALAVGAPGTPRPGAAEGGAVYVFDRVAGRWQLDGAYRTTAAAAARGFGSAVAVSLHTALIGSAADPDGAAGAGGAWLLDGLDNP
jgi:hypothetical protein